jgi:hypothetical protein
MESQLRILNVQPPKPVKPLKPVKKLKPPNVTAKVLR